jgi:ubiquinone/menaquinone biosynthesis C-methylase UbiE
MAYAFRPPYPGELIERLSTLASSVDASVLDLGCGTGDIARPLAAHVGRVTAVDPSAAMVDAGRAAPGGDAPNIEWVQSTAEQFDFNDDFSLLVTAESIHWMDLDMASLEAPGRLKLEGRQPTAPRIRRQLVEEYIEFQHSSAGFARHRMGKARAAEFDQRVRAVLQPHTHDAHVEYRTSASLIWGRVA